MRRIIREIYVNRVLGHELGFKRGTAALFFAGFHISLSIWISIKKKVYYELRDILVRFGEITDELEKYHILYLELAYKKGMRKIKVEISTGEHSYEYEIKDLYGLSCKVMRPEYMFTRILIALTRRKQIASSDLFDINYFLKEDWAIAEDPIRHELALTVSEYLTEVSGFIKDNSGLKIKLVLLYGLGCYF
ncbi:MAG: hypothetical protein ACOCXP_04500 [Candidatus Dojkabacteria bacterium]